MTLVAILADDLTGAADAGCAFANAGLTTAIAFVGTADHHSDVAVLSTASRGLSAAEAARANSLAVQQLQSLPPPLQPRHYYKKMDSALRGHPCAELVAIMDELGERRTLIAPALPAEARVTLGSRQYAGGVPIDQTEVGASNVTSALTSIFSCGHDRPTHGIDIADVRGGPEHLVQAIEAVGDGIIIVDAETDADLATIARAGLNCGIRLMAGSAGLANHFAMALSSPSLPRMHRPSLGQHQPVLIVAGSQHPATARQVAELERIGVPIVRPLQSSMDAGESPPAAIKVQLKAHFRSHGSAVLTTSGLELSPCGAGGVVRYLALAVAALMDEGEPGGLVLTGGDVAAGVATGLGARELALGGEVLPAIPWGFLRLGNHANLPVVTKAGSFGNPGALVECLRFLRGS